MFTKNKDCIDLVYTAQYNEAQNDKWLLSAVSEGEELLQPGQQTQHSRAQPVQIQVHFLKLKIKFPDKSFLDPVSILFIIT